MQKHPLLSVKEAAELLRLDERSERERLINGQLKGEKKQIGLRDKWFVYTGSVEAALSKQQGAFAGDPMAFNDVTVDAELANEMDLIEGTAEPSIRSDDASWLEANRDKVKAIAEEIVKPLMEKLESQAEVIFEQKHIISEQERQLRLLPDLQKQAEQRAQELELRHVENEALKKQIAALEQERQKAETEVERIKSEKEAETKSIHEELAALTSKLDKMEKPWWKKMFQGK